MAGFVRGKKPDSSGILTSDEELQAVRAFMVLLRRQG